MIKNVMTGYAGAACALLLCSLTSLAQDISGSNLNVTGTSALNYLEVAGIADFQSNTLYFGTSGTTSAAGFFYNDANPGFTLQLTHPLSVWNWQRLNALGMPVTAMQLDASNRLILTGTDSSNPTQIILDPNGGIALNGNNLLTQTAADLLYLPSGEGLSVVDGNVGVGTLLPETKLDVAGKLKVGTASSGTSTAQVQIGADTAATVGQVIQGAANQTAALQEWKNSAGSVMANVKIGNGGTPACDYGVFSLFASDVPSAPASMYVKEDVINTSTNALYITPPGWWGRIFLGAPTCKSSYVDMSNASTLTAPTSVTLSSGTFASTSLHPTWKFSYLAGAQYADAFILYPGNYTGNITGNITQTGMASLPFLVDTRDAEGYQRGAGYLFGNLRSYTEYTRPHTLWYSNNTITSRLMALQMTGELDLYIKNPSANGIVVKSATSQTGDLAQWQNNAGTPLTVVNKDGWVGIGTATPQAALDNAGDARIEGDLTVHGSLAVSGTALQVISGSTTILSTSNGSIGIGTATPMAKLDVAGNLKVSSGSTSTLFVDSTLGKVGIGTSTPAAKLEVAGDVKASGNLIEKSTTFIPSTAGWYRIVYSNEGTSGGVIRITADFYDNVRTDVEFQYNIGGYGVGGSIQQTRYSSYNNGCVSDARISSNTSQVFLDIYVTTATNPGLIKIYGYGANLAGLVAAPVPGAIAATEYSKNLSFGHGFRSTDGAVLAAVSGSVGIGTATPQALLDVRGDAKIFGNLAISGTGKFTLPDGTVLSGSQTLSQVITSSTAAYALSSAASASLSGTIQATQVNGLASVATGGSLDYSKIQNAPTNVSSFTNDAGYITSSNGTTNIDGIARVTGGIIVTGTMDSATNTVVATGSSQLVLIPQQGDLSMGDFTAGSKPQ